ncbi:MAG: hypothetical protein ACYCW6_04580 [Candidatus Xenobia bacterium]
MDNEPRIIERATALSDYAQALLRLQFLTAVRDVHRNRRNGWPDHYLDAATNGLLLQPEEVRLLRVQADSFAMGCHSPYESVPQLLEALGSSEWNQLLVDFLRLNPNHPVAHETVDQVRQALVSGRLMQPTDAATSSRAKSTGPLAAAPRTSERLGCSTPQNQRKLGALDTMFDEE